MEVLVNFRQKCLAHCPPAADAHQLYASLIDVIVPAGGAPDTALDFWAAARQSKADVEQFTAEPHRVIDSLDFFYTLGHHPVAWPLLRLFSASWRQGRQKALSISNLGMTDRLFQPCGPWRLGRMQMGIDELIIGHSIFLALASHEGRLNFTLSYAEPIVDRRMAQEFGQAVIRCLVDACPAPEPTDGAVAAVAAPATPVSLTTKPPQLQQGGDGGSGGSLGGGASSFSEADADAESPRGAPKRVGGA